MAEAEDAVAQRIRWVLAHVGTNPHALSVKAGLSGRHIGKLLERGNGASAELETLLRIAEAAQVNPAWLTTGQGQPTSSETTDTHNPKMRSRPGFERALQAARLLRPQYPERLWTAVADSDPFLTAKMSGRMLVRVAEILLEDGEEDLSPDDAKP